MSDDNSPEHAEEKPQPKLGVWQPLNGPEGRTPDLRVPIRGHTTVFELTGETFMRQMLADACKLLWQVTRITSGVLDTVRLADVREVCAGDMPVGIGTIREDGTYAPDPMSEAAALERADEPAADSPEDASENHRKRPRSRVHPLMMLMRLGIQAARLLKQITAGAYPHVMNALTVGEKQSREANRDSLAWHRVASADPIPT